VTDHQLEPELRRLAPRAVQRRAAHGGFITFVHLFTLPHTLIGILGLFVLVGFFGFAVFSQVVDGTVTSTSELVSRKGARSYPTNLDFAFEGRTETTNESLSERPEVGATVPLRVLRMGGELIVRPAGELWFELLFAVVFVGFWNGVMGLLHWRITFLPLRQRALVREGLPVVGRVTSHQEIRGNKGSKTYRLGYDYFIEGLTLRGQMDVRQEDFLALADGDAVTVLVSEKHPDRSVLYRCAPYEVVL
jgi:hypothetical protein